MGWYDWWSHLYDASVERLYVDARQGALEALDLGPDHRVLDLPCGTGQSLPDLVAASGSYVGVDFSAGMLARARRRAGASADVRLHEGDARTVQARTSGAR